MYPGRTNATYNNQQQQQQQQYYSRPPNPPPNVASQPMPFEGQFYPRPGGPPPNSGNDYSGQYSRPPVPPPGAAPSQQYNRSDIAQNHNTGLVNGPSGYEQPQNLYRPPTQVQYAGPGNEVAYQYSQMTGRRKALLIGINYFGSQNQLRGCINDSHNMFNFLTQRYGYRPEDIVMLNDDTTDPVRVPTRANMLRAMQWLVKDAQPNDALFFHYSGHGGQTKDLDGDEEDGMDDVIYPVDFQVAGPIIDDEMHAIMVTPLQPGVRLTALFDSCHSGTVLDLPYTYSTKGVVKEPNVWKDVGSNALQGAMAYATGNTGALMKSLGSVFTTIKNSNNNVDRERIKQIKFSPADIIMFSGSKDNQTSADATENGQNTGAMSWAFLTVLSKQPQQTYLSLLQNMRAELRGKYSQKPQLSSSHEIDVNLQFLL
ncbi:metacaspase-1 [Kluyveromyces marxianus]|uniref:Metacaspase-1 n=2 Tax=Kluyveromyces marxianus TaxID=4911 RepID=W0TCD1_KLUMD|nr:metacaspase-1 [Kluyveromyces marxianus DMKU3-1042]QGN16414.1 metacaspase-1 [Kluyveromyces marxianus]BAO40688.1 metacaspase-1 [Kluyveromyces marxianus DMKU3-1042]BAP72162.1 metacaspase-1 [Kluyveromyces marxianus]